MAHDVRHPNRDPDRSRVRSPDRIRGSDCLSPLPASNPATMRAPEPRNLSRAGLAQPDSVLQPRLAIHAGHAHRRNVAPRVRRAPHPARGGLRKRRRRGVGLSGAGFRHSVRRHPYQSGGLYLLDYLLGQDCRLFTHAGKRRSEPRRRLFYRRAAVSRIAGGARGRTAGVGNRMDHPGDSRARFRRKLSTAVRHVPGNLRCAAGSAALDGRNWLDPVGRNVRLDGRLHSHDRRHGTRRNALGPVGVVAGGNRGWGLGGTGVGLHRADCCPPSAGRFFGRSVAGRRAGGAGMVPFAHADVCLLYTSRCV